jgi:hypothetical protein
MNEAVWKKKDGLGAQPTPTWAMYAEATNKFTRSARAFMEDVHLLTEARYAYQDAMTASTTLRRSLDAGDQALRSLMTQMEQVINAHLGEPALDRKKPQLLKVESTRVNNESTGTGRPFP